MAALYRFVVEESKLDVEVSEITDGGLLGVNGILDDMALGFDDGVAGVGGMADGRGTVAGSSAGSVCRGGVVEKDAANLRAELTKLGEVSEDGRASRSIHHPEETGVSV